MAFTRDIDSIPNAILDVDILSILYEAGGYAVWETVFTDESTCYCFQFHLLVDTGYGNQKLFNTRQSLSNLQLTNQCSEMCKKKKKKKC